MGEARRLRVVGDDGGSIAGQPLTGEELLCEAAELFSCYLRQHLKRLSSDDPDRAQIEALALLQHFAEPL